MPQCPYCRRNALVEAGRCTKCSADLTLLQTVRDLSAHLYNRGLDAARAGSTLPAILNTAAAAQLGSRPEPWVLLGKLFANDGSDEHAQGCFDEAVRLGGTIPLAWSRDGQHEEAATATAELSRDDAEPPDDDAEPAPSGAVSLDGDGDDSRPAIPVVVGPAARTARAAPVAWMLSAVAAAALVGWTAHARWGFSTRVADPIPTALVVADAVADREGRPTPHRDAAAAVPVLAPLGSPGEQRIAARTDDAAPPVAVPTPGAESVVDGYDVRTGDSLWRIAEIRLGSALRWREIYDANRESLSDPHRLTVGRWLVIPNTVAGAEKTQ